MKDKIEDLLFKVALIQRNISNPRVEIVVGYKHGYQCTANYYHTRDIDLTLNIILNLRLYRKILNITLYRRYSVLTLDPLIIVTNKLLGLVPENYPHKGQYSMYWDIASKVFDNKVKEIIDFLVKVKTTDVFIHSDNFTISAKMEFWGERKYVEATIKYYPELNKVDFTIDTNPLGEQKYVEYMYMFLSMYYDLLKASMVVANMVSADKLITHKFSDSGIYYYMKSRR